MSNQEKFNVDGLHASEDLIPLLYKIIAHLNGERYSESSKLHLELKPDHNLSGTIRNSERFKVHFDEYTIFIRIAKFFIWGDEYKIYRLIPEGQEDLLKRQLDIAFSIIEPDGELINVNFLHLLRILNSEEVLSKYNLWEVKLTIGDSLDSNTKKGGLVATMHFTYRDLEYPDMMGNYSDEISFDSYDALIYYLGSIGIEEVNEYYKKIKRNRA